MAISNYGELKTAVQTFLMGATPVSSSAEDIVLLAQSLFNTRLRCREMLTRTDLSPTSGEFTLPTDYLGYKRVVEKRTVRNPLDYISLEKADERYYDRPSGEGCYFTILGTTIRVYPTITNDIELTYYQRFSSFSAESDTDWLLTRYPHIYLCACQFVAADLIKDDAEYAKHSRSLATYVEMLNGQDDQNDFQSAEYQFEGHAP